MSGRFQFEPKTRTGPCLNKCGEIVTYELTCPDPRRWEASCPACGTYDAPEDGFDDACDA